MESLLPSRSRDSADTTPPNPLVFPEFDSLDPYFVVEGTAKELWENEVNRLVEVVQQANEPLRFPSQDLFKDGDDAGYRELSKVSSKIMTAVTICLLDNECINIEHCKQLSNQAKLVKYIRQLQTSQKAEELQEASASPAQDEISQDAVFCLIDHISAVLTRLTSGTATGDYWLVNVLGGLAKLVTKLKVLLLDLPTHTSIAVSAGEVALENSGEVDKSALEEEEDCEEALRIINANTKEGLTSLEEAEIAAYCTNQSKTRMGIHAAIRYILLSLRFLDRSGLSATEYEICGLAYETGFQGFKVSQSATRNSPQLGLLTVSCACVEALLFQDRDLEYSATSDLDTLNTAHAAFSILNDTFQDVQVSPAQSRSCRLSTTIEGVFVDDGTKGCHGLEDPSDLSRQKMQTCSLNSMEDIISVMIPLIICSPVLVANFSSFCTMMALTCDVRDSVRRFAEGHFNAFFRMYTSEFMKSSRRRDVLSMSDAVKNGFFSRYVLLSEQNLHDADGNISQTPKLSQKLDEIAWEMETWVVDEGSVTVRPRVYVWTVIAVAALLVIGGLAIGFTVGESIQGVDPFNLATYSWVLAAFVVLICKSVQVDNWAWSDFLHQRVRCRSVSELQSITGVSDQIIIAKLLHDECDGSVLKTRGPFNSVFLNHDDSGFSIDRPISTSTMLLSGMTLLKVATPRGAALVCLDARRGTDLEVVEHQGVDSSELLVCRELSRHSPQGRESNGTSWTGSLQEQHARLKLTRSKDLKWKRVLGVYDKKLTKFV